MTRISDLGKNLENLPDLFLEYNDALKDINSILLIKGKSIKNANRDAQEQYFYDQKRVELKSIVDFLEMRIKSIRSKLFRSLTEHNPRELTERSKERYIDSEPEFLEAQQIYFEMKELYEKYLSINESFKARGYAMNNITKAIIASVEEVEL